MSHILRIAAVALTTLATVPFVSADEKKPSAQSEDAKPEPAKPAESKATDDKPVSPAAGEEKIYDPKDLNALREKKGQKVTLEGKIARLGESNTGGVRYLNFADQWRTAVSLVFLPTKSKGAFTKEKLKEYVGKKVKVSGRLSEFRDALQIEIDTLEQLQVLE